jgi:two-component system sensor histidine kinase/response regulator
MADMDSEPAFFRRADHGARILVVDDDAMARRTLRAMLERGHYQVETVEGGAEALAFLSTNKPDLVLLDIIMPGMDGLETCRRIRALPNSELLPIIFLTADERPEIHAEAFRAKGDDFLRKPVLAAELIVRIRSLMRLKRLQAEIQTERDTLIDLQRQREHLFAFIVHDLKNPLSTIQLGLEFLSDRSDNAPAAQNQLLRLRDTAHYMGRMIQDILDIGRAEEMGLELHKSRIRLCSWIPHLLQEVEPQAHRRDQELAWNCPEDLEMEADPDFLRRLLLNLLDNALKYSPAGSHTRIDARPSTNGIRLEVRDQGSGIPEHLRKQVFGKFMRLENEETHSSSSSGLGLAFCQMVAEAHQGRIWVEANPPKGSVFVVEFPAAASISDGEYAPA